MDQNYAKLLLPSFSVRILSYYGYMHEAYSLMQKISKKSKFIMDNHENIYIFLLKKQVITIRYDFSKEYLERMTHDCMRFFEVDATIFCKRSRVQFSKIIKELYRKQERNEFNSKFVINQKQIAKCEKTLEKVDNSVRRTPGQKKKLTDQLALLYDQKEELRGRNQISYLNINFLRCNSYSVGIEEALLKLNNKVFSYPFDKYSTFDKYDRSHEFY